MVVPAASLPDDELEHPVSAPTVATAAIASAAIALCFLIETPLVLVSWFADVIRADAAYRDRREASWRSAWPTVTRIH
jgi:hypothetical protein